MYEICLYAFFDDLLFGKYFDIYVKKSQDKNFGFFFMYVIELSRIFEWSGKCAHDFLLLSITLAEMIGF